VSRIDALPPDQRAALQLLLAQGRSYDEIAQLLRIERTAVQERARAALDALGPDEVPGLELSDQDEIADYLLGQQSASARAATRELLAGSAAGRVWARAVAGELRASGMVSPDDLPDIPAEGAEVEEAFGALQARSEHRDRMQRSSKVGGIILLAGLGIALAVLAILVLGGGDDDAAPAETAAQTQQAPQLEAQINLRPPQGRDSNALGIAVISRVEGQRVLGVTGQNVPRTDDRTAYAVWLVGGQGGNRRLGFTPPVGEDNRLQGFTTLQDVDLSQFEQVRITRETSNDPQRPGPSVLLGDVPRGQPNPPAGEQGADVPDPGDVIRPQDGEPDPPGP
jgi:hypothetical protein